MDKDSRSLNSGAKSFWDSTIGIITKITALLTAITGLVLAIEPYLQVKEESAQEAAKPSIPIEESNKQLLRVAYEKILIIQEIPISHPEYFSKLLDLKEDVLPMLRYLNNIEINSDIDTLTRRILIYSYIRGLDNKIENTEKKFLSDYPVWKYKLYWNGDTIKIHPKHLQDFKFDEFSDSIAGIENYLRETEKYLDDYPESYFSVCLTSFSKNALLNTINRLGNFEQNKKETLLYLKNRISGSTEPLIELHKYEKVDDIKLFLFHGIAFNPNDDYDFFLQKLISATSEYEKCVQTSLRSLQSSIQLEIDK